jgi:hypothetical protein
MNAPAIVSHLQAVGAELRACCDALDDADSARYFLRDMHDALPVEILTWHCYADDRIVLCPQYRALTDEAKRAVQWALSPMTSRLVCRVGMAIETAELVAAAEFLRQCRDSVADDDEVWAHAETARDELLAEIQGREQEESALIDWRDDRREWERLGYRREA